MKTTINLKTIATVTHLKNVIDQRKKLEKEEKELKKQVYAILGEANSMHVGELLVIISDRQRESLDREKVKVLLGEKFSEVVNTTKYKQLDIKGA